MSAASSSLASLRSSLFSLASLATPRRAAAAVAVAGAAAGALLAALHVRSLPLVFHLRVVALLALRRLRISGPFHADPRAPLVQRFRAWPDDLDFIGFHLNDSSFVKIADFARFEWVYSTGVFGFARTRGGFVALGTLFWRFRRQILPFSAYTVTTTLHARSPDDRWFLLKHVFSSSNRECAVGFSQCIVKARGGVTIPFTQLCTEHFGGVPDLPGDGGRLIFEHLDGVVERL